MSGMSMFTDFPSLMSFQGYAFFTSEMKDGTLELDWAKPKCEEALRKAVRAGASLQVLRSFIRVLRKCTVTDDSDIMVFPDEFGLAIAAVVEHVYWTECDSTQGAPSPDLAVGTAYVSSCPFSLRLLVKYVDYTLHFQIERR
jgi:hypothetical protein